MRLGRLNEYVGEIALTSVGLGTLVVGLFVGVTTTAGFVLSMVTVCCWTVSASAIGRDRRLRNMVEMMKQSSSPISIVPKDEVYQVARRGVEKGTKVKATFFVDFMWKLQPGERGYEEQSSEWGLTRSQIRDFENYFQIIREQINRGRMEYFWLTYADKPVKYLAVVDRLKTSLRQNTAAALRGRITMHLLPLSVRVRDGEAAYGAPVPQINMQIAYVSQRRDILITPARTRSDQTDTIHFIEDTPEETSAANGLEEWFDLLQSECIPVLNNGAAYLGNLSTVGLAIGMEESVVQEEIESVRAILEEVNVEEL